MSRPLSVVGRMDELLVEAGSQVREHRQSDAWKAENARHEEMGRLALSIVDCRLPIAGDAS